MILEDDAVYLPRRGRWVPYCLERLPLDWDLFYLGYRDGGLRGFLRELQEAFGNRADPSEIVSYTADGWLEHNVLAGRI
jgi:hypothetical protein